MRRHPKPCIPPVIFAVLQWLKVLRLLMNTRRRPPPPRLVHKWPMRWIHQPDNSVIYIARQLRHQMRTPKLSRELRHLRHWRQRLTHPPRPRSRNIHPSKPIPLFTRKRTRKNLRRVQRLMTRQRRNLLALPTARLKLPAVVFASHRLPIEPPRRQRNPPMRTEITHRKQPSPRLPPQQQRDPKQQRLRRLALPQVSNTQRRIPIPKDQLRRRSRNLYNSHQLTQTKRRPFAASAEHQRASPS